MMSSLYRQDGPMDIESDIRPISLTPNSSKVLESLISSWILAEVVDKFDDSQCNALKGCSTIHRTDWCSRSLAASTGQTLWTMSHMASLLRNWKHLAQVILCWSGLRCYCVSDNSVSKLVQHCSNGVLLSDKYLDDTAVMRCSRTVVCQICSTLLMI